MTTTRIPAHDIAIRAAVRKAALAGTRGERVALTYTDPAILEERFTMARSFFTGQIATVYSTDYGYVIRYKFDGGTLRFVLMTADGTATTSYPTLE